MKKLRKALGDYEVLMLVVMFIFVVSFMINVKDNPRASRLFPIYIGLVLICLMTVQSVITFRKKRKAILESKDILPDNKKKDVGWHRPGLVAKFVALIFLYYLAILMIGYLYASFLFLVMTMWLLGVKSKVEILLISVGTLAIIYAVFAWGFRFILPAGQLF